MEFWGKIITFFDAKMQEPTSYGWFHWMFVIIAIAATVLMCIFLKDAKDKTFRIIIGACWLTMVLFEIYKQLNYGFSYNAELNTITWDYEWYAFPFQFCSSPLYVLPFIAFLPKGHVRDAMLSFMAFFSIFGGLATFAYPEQVFISTIGINIQSMVHHGLQVVLGIYIAVYTRKKCNIIYYLKGAIVFTVLMAIAVVMNVAGYHILTAAGIDETFNMFYIGPYFDCTLPILSIIYPLVHPILFIIIYLIGFLLIGFIIFGIVYGIISLVNLIKRAGAEELRTKAKATLGGRRLKGGWMWPVLLGIITNAIASALSFVSPLVAAILGVAGAAYYVALVRRTAEAKEIGIYFKTMKTGIGKNIKLSLVLSIYQFLWFFVPVVGLIKPYSYAMTYYVKVDNPELTANEAITMSRQMMNGYKWKLFCLRLSFIGWHILTLLTFGIIGYWVNPHIAASEAEFYEKIKAANAGGKSCAA